MQNCLFAPGRGLTTLQARGRQYVRFLPISAVRPSIAGCPAGNSRTVATFNASKKTDLAIAVTGVLEEPLLFESTAYHEPKLDSPLYQKYTEACVALTLQRFTLFDVKTGETLGTIDTPKDDRTAE